MRSRNFIAVGRAVPGGMCRNQIGRTDGLTVIIVHTCRSSKISLPSLLNIVVIVNFYLHNFHFNIDFCEFRQLFYV